jgi:hypothetical protein
VQLRVVRRGVGHHIDQQALNLTRLLDASGDLTGGRRTAAGCRGAQRIAVPRHTLGQSG